MINIYYSIKTWVRYLQIIDRLYLESRFNISIASFLRIYYVNAVTEECDAAPVGCSSNGCVLYSYELLCPFRTFVFEYTRNIVRVYVYACEHTCAKKKRVNNKRDRCERIINLTPDACDFNSANCICFMYIIRTNFSLVKSNTTAFN